MWCQPVEDFSQNTDDFLSSGFHQFFTEFNNSDNLVCEDEMHYPFHDSNHSNFTNYEYLYSDQDIYNSETFNSEPLVDSIFESSASFDQNLENLLLDTSYISDDWLKPINLPEKTLLCNDSCDLFLKESSENLKLPELEVDKRDKKSPSGDSDEKVYPCTYGTCQKIYAKPAHLKAHMRRHMGDKPYRNAIFYITFIYKRYLTTNFKFYFK